MPQAPVDRLADTRVPIQDHIAARWSPRAFDPATELDADDLVGLLEAARWAATWGRRQPVRFVVGLRGDDAFTTLGGLLRRGNSYARAAAALILVVADEGPDETTALYSGVDAGAAMANLSIEAVSRGLVAHPMAGFDTEGAREKFGLADGLRPLAVVAVGTLADHAKAGEDGRDGAEVGEGERDIAGATAERDRQPRTRLPLEEVVLNWPSLPAG